MNHTRLRRSSGSRDQPLVASLARFQASTARRRPETCAGKGSQRRAPAAAVLGFFMITRDAVVVNVTLPSIRRDLGGGITGLQWVVDGYTLLFAALLLAAGPILGRLLTLLTWRLIFFVNLPVGAVALLLAPMKQ